MTLTPEEKAVLLIDRVGVAIAMYVVEEIIESRRDDKAFDDREFAKSSDYFTPHPMGLTYWKEVKNELFNFKQKEQ
jgi:hypothetical protein